MSEHDAILALQRGDDSALGVLYGSYKKLVHNRCRELLRGHPTGHEDADDLTHDVFLHLRRKIKKFPADKSRGNGHFIAWLWKLTTRVVLDARRSASLGTTLTLEDAVDPARQIVPAGFHDRTADAELRMRLHEALATLPEDLVPTVVDYLQGSYHCNARELAARHGFESKTKLMRMLRKSRHSLRKALA